MEVLNQQHIGIMCCYVWCIIFISPEQVKQKCSPGLNKIQQQRIIWVINTTLLWIFTIKCAGMSQKAACDLEKLFNFEENNLVLTKNRINLNACFFMERSWETELNERQRFVSSCSFVVDMCGVYLCARELPPLSVHTRVFLSHTHDDKEINLLSHTRRNRVWYSN